MSEDFDKEAERKRLREKYERDEEDREETERMSELLLQGATMTNRHCDTCGSPIFRHQGQEFCPTCQMKGAAAETPGAAPTDQTADETAAPQGADATATGAAGDASGATGVDPAEHSAGGADDPQPSGVETVEEAQTRHGDATTHTTDRPTAPTEAASLDEVRASLTQTLARFAQRAAETEDPHRAREYLETAQSAAETLRTVPR